MLNLTVRSDRNVCLVSAAGRRVRFRMLRFRRSILSMALPTLLLTGCTFQPILPAVSPTPTPITQPPIVATLTATTLPLLAQDLSSPDGQWRAQVVIYACTQIEDQGEVSYEEPSLIDVATGTQIEITHQQINCGGWAPSGWRPSVGRSTAGFSTSPTPARASPTEGASGSDRSFSMIEQPKRPSLTAAA